MERLWLSPIMIIQSLLETDRPEWLRMRQALWPENSAAEHQAEIEEILGAANQTVFVARRPTGGLCGFVEVSLRPWAEGCASHPVGYIEGWYVDADVRQQGVGKQLVAAAEDWARAQGCTEMGSDCVLDNHTSFRAHLALGYQEVERLILFRRSLQEPLR